MGNASSSDSDQEIPEKYLEELWERQSQENLKDYKSYTASTHWPPAGVRGEIKIPVARSAASLTTPGKLQSSSLTASPSTDDQSRVKSRRRKLLASDEQA